MTALIEPELAKKFQEMSYSQLYKEFTTEGQNWSLNNFRYILTSPEMRHIDVFMFVNDAFARACEIGNLELVKYLAISTELRVRADTTSNYDRGLRLAADHGHNEIVRYLLTSEELKKKSDIHVHDDNVFRLACINGNLPLIKYLLTSPELKEHSNINNCGNNVSGLVQACDHGNLEIVDYLLTSPELKEHADIDRDKDSAFLRAISKGNLKVVKYLLTSPKLKTHANLHVRKDYAFELALNENNLDILQYFILDLDIPRSEHINNYLKNKPNETVEKLFEIRDLQKELVKEVSDFSNEKSKVKKIKI